VESSVREEREMKRDMDLVRAILTEVERHPAGFFRREMKIDGYTPDQIKYHVYIMDQAGLVEAANATHYQNTSPEAIVNNLTWEGHEFLDNAREPIRWEQAKALVAKAGGASVQVLLTVLTDLAEKHLNIT